MIQKGGAEVYAPNTDPDNDTYQADDGTQFMESQEAKAMRTDPRAAPGLPVVRPLSSYPVIITEPGVYVMRNGIKATVHEVKEGSTFNAMGHWLPKGKKVTATYQGEYTGWHVSGFYQGVRRDHPLDIIAKSI